MQTAAVRLPPSFLPSSLLLVSGLLEQQSPAWGRQLALAVTIFIDVTWDSGPEV